MSFIGRISYCAVFVMTAALGAAQVQAADLEPVYVSPGWAGTASISGGFGETDNNILSDGGYDLSSIIGSGDFVLPIHSNWNIQLSGAARYDWLDFDWGSEGSNSQVLINTLVFYRDPTAGLFGVDFGIYSLGYGTYDGAPRWSFVRAGAVAEWYPNETFALGAFGGGLFGIENGANNTDDGDGWYIGGHATFYAMPNLAVSADGRYLELSETYGAEEDTYGSLRVGGKVRYLTSIPGLEVFAAGNYINCDGHYSYGQGQSASWENDGFEFLVGVNIRLGGNTNSLVDIDRSNAVDTRVWHCEFSELQ